MNITVRNAAPIDANAICSLSKQLGYEATVSETAARLKVLADSKTDAVFVAVSDDLVVGWVHAFYATRLESAAFVEIGGLVVDANIRGAGTGKLLVQNAIAWAQTHNVRNVRVRTNTLRLETHQFYQKIGFTQTKEQKVYDRRV
ncbi:GNAT family N-acetyltransferase [Pontibacter akesuensis]|uniref:Predicted N-acetyltransferase YhbS n=1 Tax=Pontibacter akesuensis TaxID=388950 RepID=A0A1I7KEI8_9BACT|nr:GNAT family N-acetyltransferase [Pontibacter akesuensis]GHA79821.1 hypothetical protein GCM10007389_37580 [Pontibacter akesuensis]SFU95833.1 Predicted N-acetyltransferase YhbS [Pontibacter akesuensis]